MKKITLLITFIAVLISTAYGDISVEAYVDKTTVGTADQIRFTIEISGADASKVGQPELPEIKGLRNLGVSTSSSSSYSVINGKITSSVTKSYIYTLHPTNTGKVLIPPITIKSKNKSVTTSPINITVIDGTVNPPPVSQQFNTPQATTEQIGDNLFIIGLVDKSTYYKGEPIPVEYKLYSRYDIHNLSFVAEPNFVGFWKDDVFTANRANFQRVQYKGQMFHMMPLRTVVLYPNQDGQLTIPSMELSVDIIVRSRSFFDFDSTRKINIKSAPINIEVKELPIIGRPASFTGAVGNYRISSTISDTKFNVGDTFTYQLKITGSGNVKHFQPPAFPNLPFVRLIDPEITTEANYDKKRMVGSQTVLYPVILTEDGSFAIPPIEFSYFDLTTKSYKTAKTEQYIISVSESLVATSGGYSAQKDILSIGSDVINIQKQTKIKHSAVLVYKPYFWFIIALTLLTIPFSIYYKNERDKLMSDRSYHRQKRAHKILNKYLKEASSAAERGNSDFYAYTSSGLQKYLTDTLKISRGSTTSVIISSLHNANYPKEVVDKLENLMNRFAEARFRPGGFAKDMIDNDFDEVKELISLLNQYKNKKRKSNSLKG